MSSTTPNPMDPQAPGVVVSMLRYWRWSLVIVIVFGALAYGVSLTLPKRYSASATLELSNPTADSVFPQTGSQPDDLVRYTARQAVVVKSASVLSIVTKNDPHATIKGLLKDLSITAGDNGQITISAQASTAQRAADVANETLGAYQQFIRDSGAATTGAALDAINTQVAKLDFNIAQTTKALQTKKGDLDLTSQLQAALDGRSALQGKANELQINSQAFGSGVEFTDVARVPSRPSEPQPLRNAGVAALFGLLIAGAVAWIRADRHRAADDATIPAEVLDAPMLGPIPEFAGEDDLAAVGDASSVVAESYHVVTASLQHVFQWGVLLVTSASRGDGKTVSAASIAAAAARDGTRVVLVDGDARSGRLTQRLLGATEHGVTGVTDLAKGAATRDEACRLLTLPDGVVLPFIPAGKHEGDIGSLYRTMGMTTAIQDLREAFDLVIIDCGALLAVADVASLAMRADGILLVVSRGTPIALLERIRQRLDLVTAPLVGYIFTWADRKNAEPYLELPTIPPHLAGRIWSRTHRKRSQRAKRSGRSRGQFENGTNGTNGANGSATGPPAVRNGAKSRTSPTREVR